MLRPLCTCILVVFLIDFPAPVHGQAGEKNDEQAKKLLQEAEELLKDKKFASAAQTMRKVVELFPKNDVLLGQTSQIERLAEQYERGLEHGLQARKLNDKVAAYDVLIAANAYGVQDLELAREFALKALKRGAKELGEENQVLCTRLDELTSEKVYTLTWNLRPDHGLAQSGAYVVALPTLKLPYQTTTYEINGARSQRLLPNDTNDTLILGADGNKPIELTTKITVLPYSYKKQLAAAVKGPLPREMLSYLGPSEFFTPKSPKLAKVAGELKASDPVETVRNILLWMHENIRYELKSYAIGKLDFKSVDEILDRGHAECRGHAILFTALCRAADVPARPIWGLAKVPPSEKKPRGDLASHSWGEFYINGVGWVPVDPQHPETLGMLPTYCIRIFMDERKTKTSRDNLPALNLVGMNGETLKWELK